MLAKAGRTKTERGQKWPRIERGAKWRWAHPWKSQKVEEQTSRFATYLIKRSSRALLALDWVEVPAVSRRGVFHDNPQAGWGSDRKLFHHLLVILIKAIVDPKVSYGMWQKVL